MATLYKRGTTWWIQYYIEGKKHLKSLRTKDDRVAKRIKKEYEAKLRLRLVTPDNGKLKIADALREFLKFKTPAIKVSTAKRYEQLLNNLLSFFDSAGKSYLQGLKDSDISSYVAKRQSEKAAGKTIAEELLLLKATIQYFIGQKGLKSTPIQIWPKIKKTTTKPETIERYTPEEIEKIKEHFKNRGEYDYYMGLIYLGCRRGELWRVTRGDVDLLGGTIRLENFKTGTSISNQFRTLEIHPELKPILEARCKGKNVMDRIFPIIGTGIWLTHSLRKACKKLGIPYRRVHGFRHTFISSLLNAGVPPTQVMKMVGHSNIATTMKYSHISSNDLKGKINRLGY